MYIMYLSVNRAGKLDCKCGIFIVNAEFVIYNDSGIGFSTAFQLLCFFLFHYLQSLLRSDFFFHQTVCSHLSYH